MWGIKVKQYYIVVFKLLIKNNKLNIKIVLFNCVFVELINNLVLSEYLIYLKNVVYFQFFVLLKVYNVLFQFKNFNLLLWCMVLCFNLN